MQNAPATERTQASAQERGDSSNPGDGVPRGPVFVEVTLNGFELDPTLVRIAVAKELGLSVSDDRAASPTQVAVRATAGADLVVSYRSASGAELLRAVAAPARADEIAEVSALLVGNLARDESPALLAELAAQRAAERAAQATQAASEPTPALAEPAPRHAARERTHKKQEPKPQRAVNLSFFHPLALLPDSERSSVNLELGLLYGDLGGLEGVAITSGVQRIREGAEGALIAGMGYLHQGAGGGARIGGLFGVSAGDYRGFSQAGLVNVGRGELIGYQGAGLVNMQERLTGAQLSSVNVTGPSQGAQAGVVNVATGFDGAASDDAAFDGASLDHARPQRAGLTGAQIGLVNVAGRIEGLQLGLVNIADDNRGASVGFVTVDRSGSVRPVVWYSSTQPLNLGLRLYTGPLFAMPTLGYDPATSDEASVGFVFGGRIPIARGFVDVDAGYSNRTDFASFDEHSIDLRYRVLAGYEFLPWLSVFAGAGVRHHFRTSGTAEESFDPELSAGVELL